MIDYIYNYKLINVQYVLITIILKANNNNKTITILTSCKMNEWIKKKERKLVEISVSWCACTTQKTYKPAWQKKK